MLLLTTLTLVLSAGPVVDASDVHELIILHPGRPYRIRLHIRIRGESFRTPWAAQIGRLFRHLDRDGNGRISEKELKQAPSREQWLQMSSGDPTIDPDPAPLLTEIARGKAFATEADLVAYYSSSAAGPIRVRYAEHFAGGYEGRLWNALASEERGQLTVANVRQASKLLARFDADEDETISRAELDGFEGFVNYAEPAFVMGLIHGLARKTMPVFSVLSTGAKEPLEKSLRDTYRRGEGKLGPVDLALQFDIGTEALPKVVGKPHADVSVRPTRGGLLVGIKDWCVHVRTESPAARGKGRREDARRTFKTLDINGNGYFDKGELHIPPFRFVSWERLADANQDGKITESEFIAFAELLDSLTGERASLDFSDHQRSLFHLMDSDGDNRLSRREMADAWRSLSAKKDPLARGDVPRVFRLLVTAGRAEWEQRPRVRQQTYVPPERGPVWFRRMDRNKDGDVSLSEWLGPPAEFAKIDTDGDGLISVEEAEAYDRLIRTRR